MSKKTLYERLGGYDAISAVANDLLPRLQAEARHFVSYDGRQAALAKAVWLRGPVP